MDLNGIIVNDGKKKTSFSPGMHYYLFEQLYRRQCSQTRAQMGASGYSCVSFTVFSLKIGKNPCDLPVRKCECV